MKDIGIPMVLQYRGLKFSHFDIITMDEGLG